MSNPTSNFNWQMPTATDLVTDLPADFEVFGQAVDTTMADLKGGTTGQILSKATNTDMDFVWTSPSPGDITGVTAGTGISGGGTSGDVTITNSMATAITTSGDLIQGTGSGTFARLGVGTNGQVLTSNGTSATWSAPATSGVTWTPRTNGGGENFNAVATNGSTIWVAAGDTGSLYSSTDSGVTWTSRTSGFGTTQINGLAFGNGIFVAVGNSGLLTTSTDGITWTARTAGVAANALLAVDYLNSTFIALGDGANGGTGGITTSTDGITWTKRTTPASTTGTLLSIAYGNGYYVAVGQFSTTAGVYSTNLSTWTALGVSLSQTVGSVSYVNSTFLAFSNNSSGDMYAIGNVPTGAWTGISAGSPGIAPTNQSMHNCVKTYNSKFYTTGTSGGYAAIAGLNVFGFAYTAGANRGINDYYNNIPVPVAATSTSSFTRPRCLAISSTGAICVTTQYSRVFMGQL